MSLYNNLEAVFKLGQLDGLAGAKLSEKDIESFLNKAEKQIKEEGMEL